MGVVLNKHGPSLKGILRLTVLWRSVFMAMQYILVMVHEADGIFLALNVESLVQKIIFYMSWMTNLSSLFTRNIWAKKHLVYLQPVYYSHSLYEKMNMIQSN